LTLNKLKMSLFVIVLAQNYKKNNRKMELLKIMNQFSIVFYFRRLENLHQISSPDFRYDFATFIVGYADFFWCCQCYHHLLRFTFF